MSFTDLYLDTVIENNSLYGKMYAENELTEFERIECREDIMNGQVAIYHAQEMLYDMMRMQETNVYGEAVGGLFVAIIAIVKKAILFLLKIFVGVKGMLLLLLIGVLGAAMAKKSSAVSVSGGGGGGGGGGSSSSAKATLDKLKKVSLPSEKALVEIAIKTVNSLLEKDMSPSKNISYSSFLANSPMPYIEKSEFKKLDKYVDVFKKKMMNSDKYGGYDLICAAAVDTVTNYDIYMALSLYVQNTSIYELAMYTDKAEEIGKKIASCMNDMGDASKVVAETSERFIDNLTWVTSNIMQHEGGHSKEEIDEQLRKDMELSDKNLLELLDRARLRNPRAVYPKDLSVLNAMADAFDIKVSYAKSLSELKMSINNITLGNDGHLENVDVIINNAVYSEMTNFLGNLLEDPVYSNFELDKEAVQKAVKVLTDTGKELQSLTDDLAKSSTEKQLPKDRQVHINTYLGYSIASTTALFNVLKMFDTMKPNSGFEAMVKLLQHDLAVIVGTEVLGTALKDAGLTENDLKNIGAGDSTNLAQQMHEQMNRLVEQQVIQENVRQFNDDQLRMQDQINQSMMMNMF